jgi:hypothetical protein
MSKRVHVSLLAAAALAIGSLSVAQGAAKNTREKVTRKPAEKPPAMPKPASEMAQLKFFEGSWSCEGTAFDNPMGPGGKTKGTVKSQTDLGGFWQTGTVRNTMAGMPAMEGRFNMTYDRGAKQFLLLWVDSMGGYSHETSSGWDGDKIIFTGEVAMSGKTMRARDTFTKAGAGSLRHLSEMQANGKWTPLGDETCRKSGKGAK